MTANMNRDVSLQLPETYWDTPGRHSGKLQMMTGIGVVHSGENEQLLNVGIRDKWLIFATMGFQKSSCLLRIE
jgi:hypothetical protein